MRTRRAIILIASLTLALNAYLLWTLRPFFLRPTLEFSAAVPPGLRPAITSLAKSHPDLGPITFSLEQAWNHLRHPYRGDPRTIQVTRPVDTLIYLDYGAHRTVLHHRGGHWEHWGTRPSFSSAWQFQSPAPDESTGTPRCHPE